MDLDGITVEAEYPVVERRRTGILSLDVACSSRGTLGVPMRNIIEVYGNNHTGKSTLVYYLCGALSGTGEVPVCDLDGCDPDYLKSAFAQSGFKGKIRVIPYADDKGKPRTHAAMAQNTVEDLIGKDAVSCAVLDSVTAYMPMGEGEGDVGEAFMGQRAKQIGQIVRRAKSGLNYKKNPGVFFVVNHPYAVIGGVGHKTAGGEVLKDLAGVRISIFHKETIKDSHDEHTVAFVVGGQIEKLRFGGKKSGETGQFQYVILPDVGLSKDLSCMFDCIKYGLATRERTVKLKGEGMGYLTKLVELAASGDREAFAPFREALEDFQEQYFLKNGEGLG